MIQLTPRKVRAIILLVLVVLIHLMLDLIYRPMACSLGLSDFGLKDSFTQITAVMGISLLMVVFEKEKITTGKMGKAFLTAVPVIAMLIYEFIQLLTSSLRFDIQDLVFTLVGGVFVWIIQSKIVK